MSRAIVRIAAAALILIATTVAIPTSAATADAVRDHPVRTIGCFRAPGLPAGQTVTQTVTSGGVQRSYLIHLPANYNRFRPTPVVLTFGGRGESSRTIESYTGIDDLDAIAVYPNGLVGAGNQTAWEGAPYSAPGNDVLFVSDLLNQLQTTLCVDPARIYADGKSNGGGFTALLACQLGHRIAAYAMVSGAFYPQSTVGCPPRDPISLVEFHGTADTVINYDGDSSRLGSTLPAIMDWVRSWAEHDRCATANSTPIGTDVTRLRYAHCAAGSAVVHYRVDGGGHTWPGATVHNGPGVTTLTISATQLMWRFFLAHPLHQLP